MICRTIEWFDFQLTRQFSSKLFWNLKYWYIINFLGRLWSIKFIYLKKFYVYLLINQIFATFLNLSYFKNLQVINIIILNFFLVRGIINSKSSITIKKYTNGDLLIIRLCKENIAIFKRPNIKIISKSKCEKA